MMLSIAKWLLFHVYRNVIVVLVPGARDQVRVGVKDMDHVGDIDVVVKVLGHTPVPARLYAMNLMPRLWNRAVLLANVHHSL